MIATENLSKRYGQHLALDTLTLKVPAGEILCLIGANGAGKTTTIQLLLGLVAPTSGTATIDGIDVHRDTLEARKRLLYIPEQMALYPEMSGLENLAYLAALSRLPHDKPALRDCLAQAGLPAQAMDQRSAGYSKGMRQKVGIALAIARRARVLLLDEPTSGLDPQASADFHALLRQQSADGAAILMVTHDLLAAREVATTIGVMREGRLRRTLRAADVQADQLLPLYMEEMAATI